MQDAWHRESLVLKGINTYYDRTQLSNFGNGEKIKNGNPAALEYIDKIIGLGNKFKVDLSLINAREISRR